MRVYITTQPGLLAEGVLKDIISQDDAPSPHIVIAMNVAGVGDVVTVTLDEQDLSTIARLARGSKVQRIRDALS